MLPESLTDAVVVASCLLLAALPSFVYIVIDKRSNSGRPRRVDSAALLSQMAPAARVVSSRRLVVHSASGLRVRLEYVLRGDPETQPVCMMVGGLGQQLIEWPEALIDPLLELGYCVLTYDNRDAGLSTTLDELQPRNEVINALKERVGLAIEPCYRLEDMAEDGMLLLDALSISRVDLVGQSMGGMIAQILLTRYPERVRSATLVMTCPGPGNGPRLPSIPFYLQYAYKARVPGGSDAALEDRIDGRVRTKLHIAGPAFFDEASTRERALESLTREPPLSVTSPAKKRQMEAVLSGSSRQDALRAVQDTSRVPVMVIHGDQDQFVPTANGVLLHELLGDDISELLLIKDMGHSLDTANCPEILEALLRTHARTYSIDYAIHA